MNFSFTGIKKNREFQRVYKEGKSKANKYLVMIILKNEGDKNRYGFSVSKKVGNSVERHRLVRLMREIIRKSDDSFLKSYDVIIVARNTAHGIDYSKMDSAIMHLCRLHGLL